MRDKKTILVVEDEEPLQNAVRAKLEMEGFNVLTAREARQAVEYLQNDVKIDAVWLDHYLLGEEDGLTIVAKMKEEGSVLRHVPIFVVSNTATPDKVQSYIRFGVNKYYTKADHRLDEIIDEMRKSLEVGDG